MATGLDFERKEDSMNAKMFLVGAVALSLAFAVGSASADDVQKYGATFESAVSATPGEMNDWAYALDAGVTTYANTTGEPYGWFGGADDASTIIAANGGQALQVDTGSSVLTNIDALGDDAAATEKLYECWLLNCDLTAENPGGALSITGFAVSNDVVSVTVQLVRQSPLGYINGALYLYGANDLSVGFGDRPISNEIVDFRDGDSTFAVDSATVQASGTVTQTVTATFDASIVTETFFKAKIEFPRSDEPDEPWEPDPEEPEEEPQG